MKSPKGGKMGKWGRREAGSVETRSYGSSGRQELRAPNSLHSRATTGLAKKEFRLLVLYL